MSGAASTLGDLHSVFTQCSKCETVFRLSAEVLRAAGGQVRCGKCGEVFNALAHLAEDASAFTAGESSFDLETRADSILESPAPASPRRAPPSSEEFAPPGVEIARLQILDWNENDASAEPSAEPSDPATEQLGETSLEFTPTLKIPDKLSETVTSEKQSTFSFSSQTTLPDLISQNLTLPNTP